MIKKSFLVILMICSLTVFSSKVAQAERLVTDLSENVIAITSRFSGADLLLFGAIDRNILQEDGGHGVAIGGLDYDVIIVVRSIAQDFIVRKKELMGMIWVNKDNHVIGNVPGYFVVGSTDPISQILAPALLAKYEIGLKYLKFKFEDDVLAKTKTDFKQGLIRNMKAKGLFMEIEKSVSIKEGTLFRAKLHFPANMPVGKYNAAVYLVRDGELIARKTMDVMVDKEGIERVIYNFAHENSALYGLMAIIIAVFAGWAAGFISNKMS
jgi:uncharacterized protein (TIGR02186 family)